MKTDDRSYSHLAPFNRPDALQFPSLQCHPDNCGLWVIAGRHCGCGSVPSQSVDRACRSDVRYRLVGDILSCMRLAFLAFWAVFGLAQPVAQTVDTPAMPFSAPGSAGHQVYAVLKPIAQVTTRAVLGEGRAAGLWTVAYCNNSAARLTVSRVRLMAQVAIPDLPNALAEDVVGRQASSDVRSVIGNNGDSVLNLISSGLTIGGIATKTSSAAWAGLATTGLQLIFRQLASRAPSPVPYFSQLLPDSVALESGSCSITYYVFASLIQTPKPITVSFWVP